LSFALWELRIPALVQLLTVLVCTPIWVAISVVVSRPWARSRSAWLGRWYLDAGDELLAMRSARIVVADHAYLHFCLLVVSRTCVLVTDRRGVSGRRARVRTGRTTLRAAEAKANKPTRFTGRVVLVTGASRGIGAAVAHKLAAPDTHVIVNYREKVKRARAVVEDIIACGGNASLAGADLSDERAAKAMMRKVADTFKRVDVLVLNASGGLELGADAGYAMRINRDAQVRLARLALPLMPSGGRIVFVTSHQAHFHGLKPVPPEYLPIAASKRAGEDALRGRQAELHARGITLTVVSGDMIEGTIIVRLLERRDPDAVAARRLHGNLPTVEEFASAIATAAVGTAHNGTIYIGGQDYLTASNDSLWAAD
jgi:3-oxoacyl-[acyl-carrier protein] reductase